MDIIVIRLSSLGDIVLTLPALHALRATHPGARITVMVRESYASLFDDDPTVDEVIAVGGDIGAAVSVARQREWALVVDLQGTAKSRSIARSIRARARRTVKRDRLARWSLLLRARIAVGGGEPAPPVADRFLEAVGAPPDMARGAKLALSDKTRRRAAEFLATGYPSIGSGGWIALLPGSSHPVKAWPPERFGEVARLSARSPGLAPLLMGGAGDEPVLREVAREIGGPARIWTGDGDLPMAGALLAAAKVAVANDSGLAHLAASVGCPVVSLFGPTVTGFGFTPLSSDGAVIERRLSCRPCSLHGNRPCRLGTHACLRGVAADQVMERVSAIVQSAGRVRAFGI